MQAQYTPYACDCSYFEINAFYQRSNRGSVSRHQRTQYHAATNTIFLILLFDIFLLARRYLIQKTYICNSKDKGKVKILAAYETCAK